METLFFFLSLKLLLNGTFCTSHSKFFCFFFFFFSLIHSSFNVLGVFVHPHFKFCVCLRVYVYVRRAVNDKRNHFLWPFILCAEFWNVIHQIGIPYFEMSTLFAPKTLHWQQRITTAGAHIGAMCSSNTHIQIRTQSAENIAFGSLFCNLLDSVDFQRAILVPNAEQINTSFSSLLLFFFRHLFYFFH